MRIGIVSPYRSNQVMAKVQFLLILLALGGKAAKGFILPNTNTRPLGGTTTLPQRRRRQGRQEVVKVGQRLFSLVLKDTFHTAQQGNHTNENHAIVNGYQSSSWSAQQQEEDEDVEEEVQDDDDDDEMQNASSSVQSPNERQHRHRQHQDEEEQEDSQTSMNHHHRRPKEKPKLSSGASGTGYGAVNNRDEEDSDSTDSDAVTSSSSMTLPQPTALKLRGPLSADSDSRPNVEQGLRYRKDEWLRNLLFLPSSYILYRVKTRLLLNMLIATVVTMMFKKFQMASIPVLGHNIAGGFLSLLLVFRQNSAYSRFYEARTLWSDATSACRMLALDTVTNIRPYAPQAAQKLLTLTAAFPDALTYTCLSRRYPLAHNVKKLIIPRYPDQGTILQPVTIVLLMMHEALADARNEIDQRNSKGGTGASDAGRDPLDNFNLYECHIKVHKLTDIVTGCEKIVKTPVPWSYTRHASRFLTLWCGTLASALVSTLGWLTIPTVTLVSWSLLGLEEIGHLMENPYLGYRRTRRARMTQPYDIGIPVFVLSNQARLEVEGIAALPDPAPSEAAVAEMVEKDATGQPPAATTA